MLGYNLIMRKISTYLLLFFIVFTHSTIAMNTHELFTTVSSGDILGDSITVLQTVDVDKNDCGDADMHCSHSSSHVSGIVSSVNFPTIDRQPVYKSIVKDKAFVFTQAPLLRPPRLT